jgi:hypothetical protein
MAGWRPNGQDRCSLNARQAPAARSPDRPAGLEVGRPSRHPVATAPRHFVIEGPVCGLGTAAGGAVVGLATS